MAEYALTWGQAPTQADKLWAVIAHLSCFVGFPFLGPFLLMVAIGDKSPFVKYHALQAILGHVLVAVLSGTGAILIGIIAALTCGVGGVLYLGLALLWMVPIWGAWIAWSGDWDGFPAVSNLGKP